MKCLVCFASWDERARDACPQCGYDMVGAGAHDPARVARARAAFRARSSADGGLPRDRRWDVIRPWAGLALGFGLFVFWLRACSTGGFLR
jgi:hypothetical protein